MEPRELSQRLAQNAETVARHLLPNGKRFGKEWCVGSIHGEPGDSLKVRIEGDDAGVWCDFASGTDKGDLLQLWKQVRQISFVQTLDEVRAYLGVSAPAFEPVGAKTFKRPEKVACTAPKDAVFNYLTNERRLTAETLKAFQIGEAGRDMVFPYKRDGELIMVKCIGIDRDEKGKKKVRVSPDAEPSLFGWQALDVDAETVIICEGEIDAMTLHQYGFPALSVPFGGGGGDKQRWVEYEYPHLDRFREIFLCLDNDEEGIKGMEELVRRLGAHRCKVVEMPMKDANECLQAGFDRDIIQTALNASRAIDPSELKSASVYVDEVIEEFYPLSGSKPGEGLPWSKTHQNVRLRAAELSVWTGINGHGKSQMLGQVMLEVMKKGGRVCIASMEIKPRKLLFRMVRQATILRDPSVPYIQHVHQWLHDKLWLFDVVGSTKSDRILEVFKYARKRYGVSHFVIDSLMKCGIAEDDYRGQKAFIESLADFKNEFDCHVHLVAHARKGDDEAGFVGKLDVKGTGAITDLADNCFSAWRNKKKEEESRKTEPNEKKLQEPDAILNCDKQRNGEWEGKIALWFDPESFQYLESEDTPPKRYINYEGVPYAIS